MNEAGDTTASDESTAIVVATAAAAGPAASEAAQSWFDDRLHDFVEALAVDFSGHSRPTDARQALAAAAHDLIDRVANQRPSNETAPDWPRDAVLQPNQLLANTFQVRSLIASGGVGQIYRVWHRDLRTEHAVKILLPRHVLDPALSAMLMTEARLLASIRHGGVVGCVGLLRDGDSRLLLVMDHVRGTTLAARLHQGALSVPDTLILARALLMTVAAIHAAGVVHNDLAPDNIMLRNDNCHDPVIIDFGLAHSMDAADAPETAEVSIDFAGKFSWISPERLGGAGSRSDARSDLYSLGLVLAAAAAGRRLAMGTDSASAIAARRTVPALDAIPQPLRPTLTAMLNPKPGDRPATAEAALAVLDLERGARPKGMLSRLWGSRH